MGRSRQPNPSGGTTLCHDKIMSRELAHDFHQVIARDGELCGDLRHTEDAVWCTGETHQRAQSVIRESSETHSGPFERF